MIKIITKCFRNSKKDSNTFVEAGEKKKVRKSFKEESDIDLKNDVKKHSCLRGSEPTFIWL